MNWPTENDPTNHAAVPVLDGWGWGEYWSAEDWITWHKAMKAAFGQEYANARFLTAWNQQGMFSAPLNARTFSASFREYARANGFLSGLYDNAGGAGAILNPAGSLIETGDAVAESIGGAATTFRAIGPALLVVGVVTIGFLYWQKAASFAKR